MGEEKKYYLSKLDPEDFSNWLFRLESEFEFQGVSEVLTQDKPAKTHQDFVIWKKKDLKACSLIIRSLENARLVQVRKKATAKDMLNTLKSLYLRDNGQHLINMLRQLVLTKWNELEESLDKHIMKMQNFYLKLEAAGEPISNNLQIAFFSLPERFSAFAGSSQGNGKVLDDLISAVTIEDMNLHCFLSQISLHCCLLKIP